MGKMLLAFSPQGGALGLKRLPALQCPAAAVESIIGPFGPLAQRSCPLTRPNLTSITGYGRSRTSSRNWRGRR